MYGSSTVDKAIDILLAVGKAGSITNTELSEDLGIDRSTTHRLISTLERRGFVQRVAARRYAVGNELYFFAFRGAMTHFAVIRDVLRGLTKLTGESASFSILHDNQYYCAMQQSSPHDLSYSPTEGKSYPLNAGATGATLLAFQDKARRDRILDVLPLQAYTDRTVTDRDELLAEVERTRVRGYGMSAGTRTPGGCAIACPVTTQHGAVIGAVALSAVEARTPLDELVRYSESLATAANRIGLALDQEVDE